jgi:hypothetical protein
MRVEVSKVYLGAVDELLVPMGFVRRAKSPEWSKHSDANRMWVHLNFGRGLVHPSFGVEYQDLKRRWPNLPGGVYGTMKMLTDCFKPPRMYSAANGPHALIDDLREPGLQVLAGLQDRMKVTEMLQSLNVAEWPVPSFSHRIRLAPLLLCAMERTEEALALADDFARKSIGKDQIAPSFDVFVRSLRIATTGH